MFTMYTPIIGKWIIVQNYTFELCLMSCLSFMNCLRSSISDGNTLPIFIILFNFFCCSAYYWRINVSVILSSRTQPVTAPCENKNSEATAGTTMLYYDKFEWYLKVWKWNRYSFWAGRSLVPLNGRDVVLQSPPIKTCRVHCGMS